MISSPVRRMKIRHCVKEKSVLSTPMAMPERSVFKKDLISNDGA